MRQHQVARAANDALHTANCYRNDCGLQHQTIVVDVIETRIPQSMQELFVGRAGHIMFIAMRHPDKAVRKSATQVFKSPLLQKLLELYL